MNLTWEKINGPVPWEPYYLCHALIYVGKYGDAVFRIYKDSPATLPRFRYMMKMPNGKCCWAAEVEDLMGRAERSITTEDQATSDMVVSPMAEMRGVQ